MLQFVSSVTTPDVAGHSCGIGLYAEVSEVACDVLDVTLEQRVSVVILMRIHCLGKVNDLHVSFPE